MFLLDNDFVLAKHAEQAKGAAPRLYADSVPAVPAVPAEAPLRQHAAELDVPAVPAVAPLTTYVRCCACYAC